MFTLTQKYVSDLLAECYVYRWNLSLQSIICQVYKYVGISKKETIQGKVNIQKFKQSIVYQYKQEILKRVTQNNKFD